MKRIYYVTLSLAYILAVGSNNVNAQRYVDVDPGPGTLNLAIDSDTTDTGARMDSNTIYRLQRGDNALYLLTGSISNSDYHLTIVAADGDGAMPFLQPKTGEAGSSRPFRPRGDLTLEGLHVTGIDDLGGFTTRMIRASADDIRIEVEDCWMDGDGQSMLRCDNENMTLIFRNSVISDIGRPLSPDNGRGIDDRGNNIDTVVFENCTFYNLTSRIIRDDGGWIKYCRFTNNTVVNIGQHGITFGEVGFLDVKDNLFMNAAFMPDVNTDRFVISLDSIGAELEGMGVTQQVNISNNSFWLDTAKVEMYLNDSTTIVPLFNPTAQAFIAEGGTEATMIGEMVEFADGPPFNDSIIYYDLTPGADQASAPDWIVPDIPGDGLYHRVVPYNFDYLGREAVTGSSTGGQLGDPRWVATSVVSVRDLDQNASTLSLYPVPFEDHAMISFTLSRDADIELAVFNMAGQRIATIENARYPAGNHTITWNGAGDAGKKLETGMYLLRMKMGSEANTLKIMKR
jgi:hypothetical protein